VQTMQYPMTKVQLAEAPIDRENELFKWPTENQKLAGTNRGQFLRPIVPDPEGETIGIGLKPLPWD